MARKNRSTRARKLSIPRNTHFMYSPDEFGDGATVVRYMGEQDGDFLYCFHPEGFPMWIHVHQLWQTPAQRKQAA